METTGPFANCDDCAQAKSLNKWKRKGARRQAAKVGIRYTLSEIAARDGRTCHLCQSAVDMTLSGNQAWGPTIDHLIPISKGGADAPDNVALAHRTCNERRGARDLRQVG